MEDSFLGLEDFVMAGALAAGGGSSAIGTGRAVGNKLPILFYKLTKVKPI